MNKLKKIIGSIYTSFLYIILCFLIILEFSVSYIRTNSINFTDYINGETLYNNLYNNSSIPKNVLVNYLDDYSNYIFYKRSYPTVNYNLLDDASKKEFNNIKNKLDIPFEKILIIRDINTYIHNNSFFLLLNISLLFVYLLLSLRYKSMIRGLYFMSLMVLLCSLLILMTSTFFITNINNFYIKEIFSKFRIMPSFYKINTLYISVGFILSVLSFLYNIKLKHE